MSGATSPLSREEVHRYAKLMIEAVKRPSFQAQVREAMNQAPVPTDLEEVVTRYEAVQAAFFDKPTPAAAGNGSGHSEDSTVGGVEKRAVDLDARPQLHGETIVEELKKAVLVYPDAATEDLITQLCTLIEEQVSTLPKSVPALQHLLHDAQHGPQGHGHSHATAAGRGRGGSHPSMPSMNPSPQMAQMMQMAMSALNPTQRATLERAQQTMMSGHPPSAEDMREMFLIQRQIGAFMQTMQQFGSKEPGGGHGRGGRGRGR